MFLPNKYTKIYFKIIEKARYEYRTKGGELYLENHHVIPKGVGGNNKKENLILLTYKEHYICHLLLTKMFEKNTKENNKMCYAFKRISKGNSMRNAEIAKKFYRDAYKGCNNPHWGMQHTEKTKQILSEKAKQRGLRTFLGKKHTEETKVKMRTPRKQGFSEKCRRAAFRRNRSRLYHIKNINNNEEEILFFSEFCRKYNINQENARSSVYKTRKYKHWIFKELNKTDFIGVGYYE